MRKIWEFLLCVTGIRRCPICRIVERDLRSKRNDKRNDL